MDRYHWIYKASKHEKFRDEIDVHQIIIPELKLIYIPVPKNGSTSVKHALFTLKYGKSFFKTDDHILNKLDIHSFYNQRNNHMTTVGSLKEKQDYSHFTVIRDPVKRFLSCYGNRVLDLHELDNSKAELKKYSLPIEPDIDTFVAFLENYRALNESIRFHSEPQISFLGGTLEYLDNVFPFEKLISLTDVLKKYDKTLKLRRDKSEGKKIELHQLSAESFEKLIAFYSYDYELLHPFYSKDDIIKEYKKEKQLKRW